LLTILNRARFEYGINDMMKYIAYCICLRKKKHLAKDPLLRKFALFKKGKQKLMHELDCVTLVKSIRMVKLLT
jgi:hypothetical protein